MLMILMHLPRGTSGARLGEGLSAVVWSLAESWLGVATYLDRVLLVMDTLVFRVPLHFGQFPLYRVMVVSWLSVLAVAMLVLATLVQQARALIMSGTHGYVFLELCCDSDSELTAAVVETSVAIRVTSFEDLQLVSTRHALHRFLRICKAYGVVVDIWVSIPCTAGTPFGAQDQRLCHDVQAGRCGRRFVPPQCVVTDSVGSGEMAPSSGTWWL